MNSRSSTKQSLNHHVALTDDLLSFIPKTRYYGSKRKLLPFLLDVFNHYQFQSALDIFGGTSSVALLLQRMGKDVTFNDALQSNTICAEAILNVHKTPEIIAKAELFLNQIPKLDGFITKEFANLYYLNHENQWLDGFIEKTQELEDWNLRTLVYYGVLQAALKKRPFNLFHRANLNLRTANVKRSFGNSTTWEKPFSELACESISELKFCNSPNTTKILPSLDAAVVPGGYDLVYVDPPYVNPSRHTEDYMLRYHFLEGLVNPKNWSSKIERNKKTKRMESPAHVRNWSLKSAVVLQLSALAEKHKNSIFVLSYVENAVPSIDQIKGIFSANFSEIRVYKLDHFHTLSKSRKTELTFVGIPF